MLCLSGFELYSRWVPLTNPPEIKTTKADIFKRNQNHVQRSKSYSKITSS